jgi:hypothetical protein
MKEQLLMKFKLPMFERSAFELIKTIAILGYRKTGNKFWVTCYGSKGYLSNIQIDCEGIQKADNRIFIENYGNKDGSLKSIEVHIFHSDANGVRISTGLDQRQIISAKEIKTEESNISVFGEDLPY